MGTKNTIRLRLYECIVLMFCIIADIQFSLVWYKRFSVCAANYIKPVSDSKNVTIAITPYSIRP